MLVASRTEEEYFGVKILLEFGQAVNTTVSKYIWKQVSEYHKPFTVWNRVYTYHHSFLESVFWHHKLTENKDLHFKYNFCPYRYCSF